MQPTSRKLASRKRTSRKVAARKPIARKVASRGDSSRKRGPRKRSPRRPGSRTLASRILLTAALSTLVWPTVTASGLSAQPRASERATVRQVVNGTALTLDFSRPVARGRENLFGGVVHWGELWTPGANWATTLEVDQPVTLDGHALEPGKYSVWLEPRGDGPWRLSLHRTWRLYHDAPVPEDGWALRFDVRPRDGDGHMEALNWYVHATTPRTATLRVHWGPTYVPIEIGTAAHTWDPLPADERASYVGAYAFDTRDPTTGGPMALTIEVLEEDGRLVGRWGRAPVALLPAGPGEFTIGFLRDGALFDVVDEMTLRVRVENGVSTGAELRWEGRTFGEGRKIR